MVKALTVGGLFSGIGGWELGLERAGMEIAWHCEADPFCRRVLERHWPGVPTFEDVKTLTAGLAEGVDVMPGGFPCQPVSRAGLKRAQDDERWLWPEFFRLVCEFRPRYVLVENVTGLLTRGFGDILRDLASIGYDTEWDCIPALAIGAPHQRDRVWLVAYPDQERRDGRDEPSDGRRVFPYPGQGRHWTPQDALRARRDGSIYGGAWASEPALGRMAYGVPDRVDRVGALGNALVPQIAEWIGRRIVAYELDLVRH